MSKSLLHKILLMLVSITSILIFYVPFSLVNYEGSDIPANNGWRPVYLLQDITSSIVYIPFTLLWYICLIVKPRQFRNTYNAVMTMAALTGFIISIQSAVLPVQDYKPYTGVLLSLLIFPLFAVYLIIAYRLK